MGYKIIEVSDFLGEHRERFIGVAYYSIEEATSQACKLNAYRAPHIFHYVVRADYILNNYAHAKLWSGQSSTFP